MTMHVNLSTEMENYIKGKVAGGFYGNTEVIRDAIAGCRPRKAVRPQGRQRSPRATRNSIGAKVRPIPLELMERITQSAIAAMHNAQPIDPNVLP